MPDNATRYRSAYAQTHVERLQEAMIIAEKELTAEYGSEAAKVKYYQDLIKTEEEYIRKVQDAQLKAIEDNKDPDKSKDRALKALIGASGAFNNSADANYNSASLRLNKERFKAKINDGDPSVNSAIAKTTSNIDTAKLTSNNPAQLDSTVRQALANDPSLMAAMQNADPLHQREGGAQLSSELQKTGLSRSASDAIVVDLFGFGSVDDIDPNMVQADKELAASEIDRIGTSGGGTMADVGKILLKVGISELDGGATTVSDTDKKAVANFTKDPQYAAVKKYVSENGSIEGYPDPTIVEDYNIVKDIIGKAPKAFSDNDTRYFDETYLVRQKQITDADKRIADAKERMAAIDQLSPPKIEDIRRRAAEIDRPQRQRGLMESQATKSFYGDHPSKNLTDAQKIMMQQTSKAYKSVSDPDYAAQRAADKSKSRAFSDNLWSQYKNGTLDPKQLSAKAAELAGGDIQYRNEIISKFLENQISDKQSGKFTKVDAQGTPVKAETPKAPKTSGMDASASAQVAPIARAPQAPITPVMDEEDLATLAAKRASLRGTMARDTVGDRVGSKLSQGRIEILNYLTNRNRVSTDGAAYVGDDNFMQSLSDSTSVPLSNRYGSQVGTIDNPPMRGGTNRPVSPSIGSKPVEPIQTVLTPDEAAAIQSWRDLQRELKKK